MHKKIETVSNYIAAAPAWSRPILKGLRAAIKAAAPKAAESISYHMPYYSLNGRLAYFAAHTKHVGFYWLSAKDKKEFAKELLPHKVVGSSLHIPHGGKTPVALIKKIIKARAKDNGSKDTKMRPE